MKKKLQLIIILLTFIKSESIIYYYNDNLDYSDSNLKEILNVNYLGVFNDELVIFEIKNTSKINFPDHISKSSKKKLYSIPKNKI